MFWRIFTQPGSIKTFAFNVQTGAWRLFPTYGAARFFVAEQQR